MKENRRIQKTKLAIRNAFLALVKKKDIDSITITELADKANIDRKTFYYHYQSIYDIVIEYEKEAYDKAHIMIENTDPKDINSLFQGFSNILIEDMDFHSMMAKCSSLQHLQNDFILILKNNFIKSYKNSTKLCPEEFEVCTEFLAAGIIGIYINWLSDNKSMTLEQLTKYATISIQPTWEHYLRNNA